MIMEKSMTEYLNALTSSDLETLDQIITLQYRKFIRFYRLIEDYSGIIKKVKYTFECPESLDILIVFDTKRSIENIRDELLLSMTEKSYTGDVKIEKKNMYMSITLDEKSGS